VTNRHQAWRPVDEIVSAAVSAGARWVWLRDRDLEAEPRRQLALRLAAVMREARGVLTIGGDIELATAIGCGAVHVRDVADVGRARRMLGRSAWIGMSAHSVADVGNASAAGADYVTLSPIYATASKPGYGPALGADAITLAAKSGIPVLALGGICGRNASTMRDAGAAGVAVMGGIMRSENPTGVVKALLDTFRRPAVAIIEPAGCPR
jgi:thiamine-phosphate pyrophosphorylase